MRKILSFLIVAATIYFVACNVEEEPISQTRELPTKNPYAISIPQAIERLNAIFPDATKTTRTTIADVATITRGDLGLTTRAVNGALPTDPLIYIIPTDNNGCAIVGADKRMEAVYAVLDNSTLTAEDILGIGTRSDSQNEEDGVEIKEFVSTMLNDAITYNARMVGTGNPNDPEDDNIIIDTTLISFVIDSLPPLLKTKWHQYPPYTLNNLNIKCGPIAISQLLYFHKPDSISTSLISKFAPNWEMIRLCEYDTCQLSSNRYVSMPLYLPKNNAGVQPVALFVSTIATIMNINNGTTSISGAKNALYSAGFKDITSERCNSMDVKDFLSIQKTPLYIEGVTDKDQQKGHAWVIDGYLHKYYYNQENNQPTHLDHELIFLHCNYGWSGYCDGYYAGSVFDISKRLEDEYLEEDYGDIKWLSSLKIEEMSVIWYKTAK